jgi:hypothetical protein
MNSAVSQGVFLACQNPLGYLAFQVFLLYLLFFVSRILARQKKQAACEHEAEKVRYESIH